MSDNQERNPPVGLGCHWSWSRVYLETYIIFFERHIPRDIPEVLRCRTQGSNPGLETPSWSLPLSHELLDYFILFYFFVRVNWHWQHMSIFSNTIVLLELTPVLFPAGFAPGCNPSKLGAWTSCQGRPATPIPRQLRRCSTVTSGWRRVRDRWSALRTSTF